MVITRKVEFSSSHMCRRPDLSEEENRRIYDPDPVTGMVLDLKELKEILARQVVDVYDHRFLNYEVPPFDRVVPTAENIARDIWQPLAPQFAGGRGRLRAVRVYETPDLYVDYCGEAACSA
jgi:6-pyruvoyltetrahydropterin/6-carboxytetrahydropterin synthase